MPHPTEQPAPRSLRTWVSTLAMGTALCLAFLQWGGCGDGPARETGEPGPPGYDADGRLFGTVERPARPPNLVVILIDTLRGDALGGPSGLMPGLAELAARWGAKSTPPPPPSEFVEHRSSKKWPYLSI